MGRNKMQGPPVKTTSQNLNEQDIRMRLKATQNFSSELVAECVAGRGPQTLDNKNDTDTETTSPWKYPSFNSKKKGTSECSHKVIEKRRRDRINKCLADLGQIVPTAQNGKQGSGKLEKAEILELTVEYLKNLQVAANNTENGAPSGNVESQKTSEKEQTSCTSRELQAYSKGYSDCTSEVLRFLVTVEATDPRLPCFQRLMAHLRIQCRHLIDLPDHDNKRSKQNTVTTSSTKTHQIGKKNNSKAELQSDGPSSKRQRIEVDSPVNSNVPGNGNEKAKNLTVMGFLEENGNPAYNKGHRSVGSSSMSSSNGNSNPDSMNGNNSGNNNDMNGNSNNYPAQYPNNNSMPFPNHFYPPSYGFPTYALHPAGTHYIPVALHPGIQMPGNNMNGTLPAATLINPGLGFYGSSMSGLPPHPPSMAPGPPPAYGPLGGSFNAGLGLGGMGTSLGGMGLGLGGMPSGLAGPGGLPVYLSMAQKEQNRNRGQDSNGSSENESNSSSDEYNFSSSSSGNISEVGIQTEQLQDHSDYFSAGSR